MRRLWSDVWDGVLSCEGFSPLRSGLLSGFSFKLGAGTEADWGAPSREKRRAARSAAGRWGSLSAFSGKWFSLSLDDDGYDEIDREEIGKDRVRQLLSRYGVIFRELLARELPLLRYGVLARTLRIMELSGEIVSGRFFDGIDGPQFMTPASLAALEALGESEEVYWMNAADPASLCGLGLLGLPFALPQRIPTNHVVFKGTAPLLISRRLGKELEFFCGPDEPALASSVRLFSTLTSRSFNPLPSVKVELINGEPAVKSPYAHRLIEEGFVNDYKGLTYRGGLGR
jgi:ATP-dependent Lhr-like helicase